MRLDTPILHTDLPDWLPWRRAQTARLPGTRPLETAEPWLIRDAAFGSQMALRDRLIAARPAAVHAQLAPVRDAVGELYHLVLGHLGRDRGYTGVPGGLRRPDGVVIALDRDQPLITLGRLVQADLCLLDRPEGAQAHRLQAAILCFPSRWWLHAKLGRPLGAIHAPVPAYDAALGLRVQRMFDHLRPGICLTRANVVLHGNPALFQPNPSPTATDPQRSAPQRYLRAERQCIVRLPQTGSVVFSIHTAVVDLWALGPAAQAEVAAHLGAHPVPRPFEGAP